MQDEKYDFIGTFNKMKSILVDSQVGREGKLAERVGLTPEELWNRMYQQKYIPTRLRQVVKDYRQNKHSTTRTEQEWKEFAFLSLYTWVFGFQKAHQIYQHIASPDSALSLTEKNFILASLENFKDDPSFLVAQFYNEGLFTGLMFKGTEGERLLNQFAQTQKTIPDNNLILATTAYESISRYPGFEGTLYRNIDQWTSKYWAPVSLKQILKINPDFTHVMFDYLRLSSPAEYATACAFFNNIDALSIDDQEMMWKELYSNSTIEKRRAVIHTFLQNEHSLESNRLFYQYFQRMLPESIRQSILGSANDKMQQKYLRLLKQLSIDIADVKVQIPHQDRHHFLAWELFHKGKLTAAEMIDLLKHQNSQQKQPSVDSFLFHEKEILSPDIFMAGCQKFQDSMFDTLRWLSSYKKTAGFPSWLAVKWPEIPIKIRQNPNVVVSMNNHFDLMYQLALRGDTAMLNEIKNIFKDDLSVFERQLLMRHENGDTIVHALCRQSKKGILTLLQPFSKEKQNQFLTIPNLAGQTPLDCCSVDFRRYMDQKSFVRPKVENVKEEGDKSESITSSVIEIPVEPVAPKKILRGEILLPRFKRDQAKLTNMPDVLACARKEITDLRTMSPIQLQLRMREDIKPNIVNKPCVADFNANGSAYRMGYVVENDVISFLFLMTHQQYDNELQNTRNKRMSKLTALGRKMAKSQGDY